VRLLRANRHRLDALSQALLDRETLDEDEAYEAAGVSRDRDGTANGHLSAAAMARS
jgi:ATP-dependent Zn protease